VLYYVHPLPFRCRTCCDLAYPSQYQSRDRSYFRQLRGLIVENRTDSSRRVPGWPDDFGWSGVKVKTRLIQGLRSFKRL